MPAPSSPPDRSVTRSGVALRHRAARLLARLHHSPAPGGPSRQAQARALLAVLDEAVAAQRPADAAVAACGEPGPVAGRTAQDCGRAGSAFLRLRARLLELPLTEPDLLAAQAYAGRLLAYDQWMVRQSLNLAFSVHPDVRTEEARQRLNGLSRPADDLRRLRDALRSA
ncbi:hypothetical protein [Streptomyces sp. NBC_01235]|uniref:hypothetical protein n=1 Tax=Streptomyces sp. NBC_01235 TaxID=2903788 RepID=UPI002E1203D1|nr:hypothetical protein OG289_47035 [Streptomyces sp. NBC_01235]